MRPVLIVVLRPGFNLAFALAREIRVVDAHMSVFHDLPLGHRIPDRLHAVSCSLPTMRDLIGYEEKDPAVVRHITLGFRGSCCIPACAS